MPHLDLMTADGELFARLSRGDVDAFRVFHDRHRAAARLVAGRILDNAELAEEAVQEAFVSVWDGRLRYDEALGAPAAWLLSIVRNRAIDCWRWERRRPAPAPNSEASFAGLTATDNVEEQIIAGEQRREIRLRVTSLPSEQRHVVEMAYYQGLSHSEIAHELRLPLGTAKGRMRLGLKQLRIDLHAELELQSAPVVP